MEANQHKSLEILEQELIDIYVEIERLRQCGDAPSSTKALELEHGTAARWGQIVSLRITIRPTQNLAILTPTQI